MVDFLRKNDCSKLVILSYGFVAALTYDFVAKTYKDFPLLALPLFALLSLLLILPFAKVDGIFREFSRTNIIRPVLFSIGQLLVVGALSYGTPFATFVYTAAGTIFVITVGKLLLKEKIGLTSFLGVVITISGVFLINKNSNLPYLALFAGLVQGTGVFFARKRTIQGAQSIDMAGASLLFLFIISVPIAIILTLKYGIKTSFNWNAIFIAGSGFAFLQSAYCYLARRNESWMLSLVGNTRIPASVLISALLSTQAFSWQTMGLSVLIFLGIIMAYLGSRKTKPIQLI